jgi:hypothetical protein
MSGTGRPSARTGTDRYSHRMLVAPCAAGLEAADSQDHWRERHSLIVPDIDDLAGYVQNRPLPEWWDRLPFVVCADTWFVSREAERVAYASPYYLDDIVTDEARFIDRDAAWQSPVVGAEVHLDGPLARYRVLAFGAGAAAPGLDGFSRVERVALRRPAPGAAVPDLLSAWTDELERATALADRCGGTAYVAEPALVVPPPVGTWPTIAPHGEAA